MHTAIRPKALRAIREERLAAKEQIKATAHVLQHVGLDLDSLIPETPLRQIRNGETRHVHVLDGVRMAFIADAEGNCEWNAPEEGNHVRLVLNPDEGSALFCGYEFLAQQNLAISLRRDELTLVLHNL